MHSTWQFTAFGFVLPASIFCLHQLGLWMQRHGWMEYARDEETVTRAGPKPSVRR
ncbi:MAG TPA: hypothetical protein VHD76_11790 [Bryobacteraceae bacterium]|jgi:hypothetical protein|nr:hypothetical protein [Bryobacteraceae bacterium]